MNVLVTGTSGRVGRAIYLKLMRQHAVVGVDLNPSSTADIVGDLRAPEILERALDGADAIVHTAALHAPHVGVDSEHQFRDVNFELTTQLFLAGVRRGVEHFVFTSTTALYGAAATDAGAAWVTEDTPPSPRTIYHRTKTEAESLLAEESRRTGVPVTVLQMSRCFPEPADVMAVYRLHRGVDARDVATAHGLALDKRLDGFRRFIVSAATPFQVDDCKQLYADAASTLRKRAPELADAFDRRGWSLPTSIDRVYDSSAAQRELGWSPQYGFEGVLRELDEASSEVLAVLRTV